MSFSEIVLYFDIRTQKDRDPLTHEGCKHSPPWYESNGSENSKTTFMMNDHRSKQMNHYWKSFFFAPILIW